MEPVDFEKQVARILGVLNLAEADVTWNEHMADPDNPDRLRQIDVTIRRPDCFTIVECRHHQRPQDVGWIEQLVGRRMSLRADAAIAVSSSGFTEGAARKAEAFGIFLRTLAQITDAEVAAWGMRTRIQLWYLKFSRIHLSVVCSDSMQLPIAAGLLQTDTGQPFPLGDALKTLAQKISDRQPPAKTVSLELRLNRIWLGKSPVDEAILTVDWEWLNRTVALPAILEFAEVSTDRANASQVERALHGSTEVVHTPTGAAVFLDLSGNPQADCCYFRRATLNFSEQARLRLLGITGLNGSRIDVCEYTMDVITRSDSRYQQMMQSVPFQW